MIKGFDQIRALFNKGMNPNICHGLKKLHNCYLLIANYYFSIFEYKPVQKFNQDQCPCTGIDLYIHGSYKYAMNTKKKKKWNVHLSRTLFDITAVFIKPMMHCCSSCWMDSCVNWINAFKNLAHFNKFFFFLSLYDSVFHTFTHCCDFTL